MRPGRNGAVGNALRGVPRPATDLTKLNVSELIDQLDHPQLEHCLRVLNWLTDVKAADELPAIWNRFYAPNSPRQLAMLVWLIQRLDRLDAARVEAAASSKERETRAHAIQALAVAGPLTNQRRKLVLDVLSDPDPFVQRAAASATNQGDADELHRLLQIAARTPADDALRRLAARLALRARLALLTPLESEQFYSALAKRLLPEELLETASIASLADSPGGGKFAILCLSKIIDRGKVSIDFQRLARNIAPEDVQSLIDMAAGHPFDFAMLQGHGGSDSAQTLIGVYAGLSQRVDDEAGAAQVAKGREKLELWGIRVVETLLAASKRDALRWREVPIDTLPPSENPWVIAARPSADGNKDSLFYYSLPRGEQRTGIFRSAPFKLPGTLSFWCAGHSGLPGNPLNDGNYVRLRDADTDEVLVESRPPRNDTAQRMEWDLSRFVKKDFPPGLRRDEDRTGYIELVDGDTAGSYAWLAVGRFSMPNLNPDGVASQQQMAADIALKLKLVTLRPQLAMALASGSSDIRRKWPLPRRWSPSARCPMPGPQPCSPVCAIRCCRPNCGSRWPRRLSRWMLPFIRRA